MKKLLLVLALLFYAPSILSSGGSNPKRLQAFMTLPADFEDYSEAQLFNLIATEFRKPHTSLRVFINPFTTGIATNANEGWFHEILEKGCAHGNDDAKYIRAEYEKMFSKTDSYWAHHHWDYDADIIENAGNNPRESSDEEFFKVLKARENDPRAADAIKLKKKSLLRSIKDLIKEVKDEHYTDPQDFIRAAQWLKNCRDTGMLDLKAPKTYDYYIKLCEERVLQLQQWKKESEFIKNCLSGGNLTDEALNLLKKQKGNPYILNVAVDFNANVYPRLKQEFNRANTVVEIDRALKFLKALQEPPYICYTGDIQKTLTAKKEALEKLAPPVPDPNPAKGKKNNQAQLSGFPVRKVLIGLVLAAAGYLAYNHYLNSDASKDTEAELEV